jgi:hypothetical protein
VAEGKLGGTQVDPGAAIKRAEQNIETPPSATASAQCPSPRTARPVDAKEEGNPLRDHLKRST